MSTKINLSSYLNLPHPFYQRINPSGISDPKCILFNYNLAELLDINQDELEFWTGNHIPHHLTSIALAYAGHQFGHYVPLLGDGRVVLLGEQYDKAGTLWDIQLKGSGRTQFSRSGDGRCPLSAALREYLISEAMHGLGISTTRSLAVISSSDTIYRPQGPIPLGILTRLSKGFLRIGSFQYAAQHADPALIKQLTDYAIARHFPVAQQHHTPYLAFLYAVMDAQAKLIADWLGVGFIHGVMNTDNMSICGETIDYGPCAFMDEYDENKVFSSIDIAGRYAFNNQAYCAHWNLARLSDTLVSLVDDPEALHQIVHLFPKQFKYYWNQKLVLKLGFSEVNETTQSLAQEFLVLLQRYQPDYTRTFRLLAESIDSIPQQTQWLESFGNHPDSRQWFANWLACISQQPYPIQDIKHRMHSINPAYIPRNHLIEQAIQNHIEKNDRLLMDNLLKVFSNPYLLHNNDLVLQNPPLPQERIFQTFCGT